MDKKPRKRVYKGGYEKRREKLKRELERDGDNPKQRKLFDFKLPVSAGNQNDSSPSPSEQLLESETTNENDSGNSLLPGSVEIDSHENTSENMGAQEESEALLVQPIEIEVEKSICLDDSLDKINMERDGMEMDYTELWKFVPLETHISLSEKLAFMKHHPVQPIEIGKKLPFNACKTYKRSLPDGTTVPRQWLSYCLETNKMHCSVCMTFAIDRESPFINGLKVDVKHIYAQIDKHESSSVHCSAVRAYIQICNKGDIETLINKNMVNKRQKDIELRRKIVTRIIDIILLIGSQGLAYRGTDEVAAELVNRKVNHGNFLELVLLISKYDQILKSHVDTMIQKSKERKEKNPDSQGRGNLITFLSKSFVNKLIKCIAHQIKLEIVKEIKQAGIFSIEVDSTQDVSVLNQLAICVRYVIDGQIKTRLLSLSVASKSTGEALYLHIRDVLEKYGIKMEQIVACSLDGAANMSGQYKGLRAHLQKVSPGLVHVHCSAHVLNLVLTNSTESCKKAKDFLGLLQKTAVFLSDSHKRMSVWTTVNQENAEGHELLRRLQKINVTRWWSKDRALSSIFDDLHVQFEECNKFSTLLVCLYTIANNNDFAADVTFTSRMLLENWCRLENVLMAFIYRDLFNATSPVSHFLQTEGLQYATARKMVASLYNQLEEKRENFESLYKLSIDFVEHMNARFSKKEIDISLDTDIPSRRIRIAKKRPGEIAEDESRKIDCTPSKIFERDVYLVIIDTALQNIQQRFVANEDLLQGIDYLDPKNFKNLSMEFSKGSGGLNKLAELSGTDSSALFRELMQFMTHFKNYSQENGDFKNIEGDGKNQNGRLDDLDELKCKKDKDCNKCLACAFKLLHSLNSHGSFYTNLFMAYKFALTLSCTQVSCERVFSILKIIKNRLRSSLGEEILEDLIFLYVERDFKFDHEKIINDVAASSVELGRLLKL